LFSGNCEELPAQQLEAASEMDELAAAAISCLGTAGTNASASGADSGNADFSGISRKKIPCTTTGV
jgi:hypothetical protein